MNSFGSTLALAEKAEKCLENAGEKVCFIEPKDMKELSGGLNNIKLTYENKQISLVISLGKFIFFIFQIDLILINLW